MQNTKAGHKEVRYRQVSLYFELEIWTELHKPQLILSLN